MKEMFIPCATPEEKQKVIQHLVSIGYIDRMTNDDMPNIVAYDDGDLISTHRKTHNHETITPQQLLNKQETTTMNKLKQAVENSGFTKSELSRRLGKSRNYIGELLRVGCTTAKQNELISQIELVKSGEVFKSDAEIIAELSEKLANAQDWQQHNAECSQANLERAKTADESVKRLSEELAAKHGLLLGVTSERDNLSTEKQRLSLLVSNHENQNKALQAKYDELEAFSIDVGKLLKAEQSKTALLEDELTKAGGELLDQDGRINKLEEKAVSLIAEQNQLKSGIKNLYIAWSVTFVFLLLAIYLGWVV